MKSFSKLFFTFLMFGSVSLSAENDGFTFMDFIDNIKAGNRKLVESFVNANPNWREEIWRWSNKTADVLIKDLLADKESNVKKEDFVFFQSLLRATQFDRMTDMLILGKTKEFKRYLKNVPEILWSQDCFGDWFYDYLEDHIKNGKIKKNLKYVRSICAIVRQNRSLFEDLYRAIKKGDTGKIKLILLKNSDLILQEVKKGRGFEYYIQKAMETGVLPEESGNSLIAYIEKERAKLYPKYGKWVNTGMQVLDFGADIWDNFGGKELEEESQCLGSFCKWLKKLKGLRIRK